MAVRGELDDGGGRLRVHVHQLVVDPDGAVVAAVSLRNPPLISVAEVQSVVADDRPARFADRGVDGGRGADPLR